MSTEQLAKAYEAGVHCASNVKVGDTFMGALPEATRLGFTTDPERRMFIDGYLETLREAEIITDLNGVVIADPWKHQCEDC